MQKRFVPFLTLVAVATSASAQSTPPAATPGLGGTAVAGVCLLSREAIFANAKIGAAASARLKVLADQAQAEVDAQRKPIEAEVQAFQAEAPKLTPEQRNTRQQALAAKAQPVQTLAAQRSREIEVTREKALQRIATEAQPVIAQVYKQRNCGLLLDRTIVLGGNLDNDITVPVVQGLDAKISTITFNRETIAAPAAPAQR